MQDKYPDQYMYLYKDAVKMRAFQLAIADEYRNQKMRCPVHLSIGQEYWLPLVKKFFQKTDRCFSSHRSHSMYLALACDCESLIAELHGSEFGSLHVLGGSMPLKELDSGLEASIPIVGSSIALGVGSALSAKHSKNDVLTISYFGDGACEEGIFHECLNLAALYKLPILFICENNSYSCNTHYSNRQTANDMTRFPLSHGMTNFKINNLDPYLFIESTMEKCFSLARDKPVFLEISSYRLYEHCGHLIDLDRGDRTYDEYLYYQRIDPVNQMLSIYPNLKNDEEIWKQYYIDLIRKYE